MEDKIAIIGISFNTPILVHVAGQIETSIDNAVVWQKCKLCGIFLISKQPLEAEMVNTLFTQGSYVAQDTKDRLKEINYADIPSQTKMCK